MTEDVDANRIWFFRVSGYCRCRSEYLLPSPSSRSLLLLLACSQSCHTLSQFVCSLKVFYDHPSASAFPHTCAKNRGVIRERRRHANTVNEPAARSPKRKRNTRPGAVLWTINLCVQGGRCAEPRVLAPRCFIVLSLRN